MSAVMRLTLAREELFVLMQIGKLPGMVGLEQYVPDEHGESLFNLALRTLMARGLVRLTGETLTVDETTLGIVAACVAPDVVAMITTHTPGDKYTTTFPIQLKPGLFLSHEQHQFIDTFELFEDMREIAEAATKALRFPVEITDSPAESLRLRSETMNAARALKDQGASAILAVIERDSGHPEAKKTVAQTMATAIYNGTFTLFRTLTSQIEGFALLGNETHLYLVTLEKEDNTEWSVLTPVTTQSVRRRVHGSCLTVL